MSSGNQNLRTLWCIFYFQNIQFNSLCRLEHLGFYLLVFCKHSICLSKINAVVSSHASLNNTCYNVSLFSVILIENHFPLFLTDFLKNHIFRILCSNTSKLFGFHFYIYHISQCILGMHHSSICKTDFCHWILHFFYNGFLCKYAEITGLRINIYLNVICFSKMILACLNQRLLNSLKQCILADRFFFFQNIQRF